MKLHLPKLLLVAVAAASFAQAETEATVSTKVHNVGSISEANKLPSSNVYVLTNNTEDGFKLTGQEKLGCQDGTSNNIKENFGIQEWQNKGVFKDNWQQNQGGLVTPHVKVNGTLTIEEEARVVLGGQYIRINKVGTKVAERTGIIADKVVVKGNAGVVNLKTDTANIGVLDVQSGKVEIHMDHPEGNSYFNYDSPVDSKQVHIQQGVNISGGTTTIGRYNADYAGINTTHIPTCFGTLEFINPTYSDDYLGGLGGAFGYNSIIDADSANIRGAILEQSDGTFNVYGASTSVGGLNIKQSGGTMNISTNGSSHAWHTLADYGDSTIIQSGETSVLNIGGIAAYNSKYDEIIKLIENKGAIYDATTGQYIQEEFNNRKDVKPMIDLVQQGTGSIHIFEGIDFSDHKRDNFDDSNITQTGGGNIILDGKYTDVQFDIVQHAAGGSIQVNADLNTDTVVQNKGSISVAADKTFTANTVMVGVSDLTVDETTGKITVATDASASVSATGVELSNGSISTAEEKVTITGTLHADSFTVGEGCTLENMGCITIGERVILPGESQQPKNVTSTFALMTADEQAEEVLGGTITILSGEVKNYGTITNDIVVEGGTLTLQEGASVGNVTLTSGTIDVIGTDVQTGSLTLNGGTINFSEGATVVLGEGDEFHLSNTTIVVKVDDVNNMGNTSLTLFSGLSDEALESMENISVTFSDGTNPGVSGNVVLGNGSIKVESTTNVPEPTTATLSLLALAGLCARRRRA